MRSGRMLTAALTIGLAASALGATAGDRCRTAKLREAAKYTLCRLKAESSAVQRGTPPDFHHCEDRLASRWTSAEARAGGACPTVGDEAAVRALLAQQADDVATALAGDGLPTCATDLAQCHADLASCATVRDGCEAEPKGQRIATGSSACTDNAGAPLPCDGTGQDGELRRGLARAYVDNGDGTVTDTSTGLTWEKLSQDDTIHSVHPLLGAVSGFGFTWTDAVTIKIATLNGDAFAGHTDWRLPNANELQSLIDYGRVLPAIDPAFNANCVENCTVLTCSCTRTWFDEWYWTATSFADPMFPDAAWVVDFDGGHLFLAAKHDTAYVRAVRGGSQP